MVKESIGLLVKFFLIMVLCTFIASADQTNDSDKYTFTNYGGEVYTPEPMEFGANLNGTEQISVMTASDTLENQTERKHVLLQFYDNTTNEQLLSLGDFGVKILDVAADDTYIVSMPADFTPADLPAESGLRWMGEIPIENKYDKSHGLNVPEWARTGDGQVELWLAFYDDVTYEEAQAIASNYSTSSPKFEMYPYNYNCIIETNESNIPTIASEDFVKSMTFAGGEFVDENSVSSKKTPGFEVSLASLGMLLTFFILRRRE